MKNNAIRGKWFLGAVIFLALCAGGTCQEVKHCECSVDFRYEFISEIIPAPCKFPYEVKTTILNTEGLLSILDCHGTATFEAKNSTGEIIISGQYSGSEETESVDKVVENLDTGDFTFIKLQVRRPFLNGGWYFGGVRGLY